MRTASVWGSASKPLFHCRVVVAMYIFLWFMPRDKIISWSWQMLITTFFCTACVITVCVLCSWRAGIACWLECWTCDRKVASSNHGWSGRRIFLSRLNFVCWLLFGVCSTPLAPQWHIKDPGHSAKSVGGRLHQNRPTSLTQRGVGWLCRCPGIVWESTQKWAHTRLVREHSATVVSGR